MDSVVAAESTAVEREVGQELHKPINQTLDIGDAPKIRTKLHLYTILLALYVSNTLLALTDVANTAVARFLHSRVGSNNCRNCNPNNLGRPKLRRRIYLDRKFVSHSEGCMWSNLGEMQRYLGP